VFWQGTVVGYINSTSTETWFHAVNPYKMVPALEDVAVVDSGTSPCEERINVFDSSACLLYLADKYDKEGVFGGRGLRERASVISWLMGYTAGLGWAVLLPLPSIPPHSMGSRSSPVLRTFQDSRSYEPRREFASS